MGSGGTTTRARSASGDELHASNRYRYKTGSVFDHSKDSDCPGLKFVLTIDPKIPRPGPGEEGGNCLLGVIVASRRALFDATNRFRLLGASALGSAAEQYHTSITASSFVSLAGLTGRRRKEHSRASVCISPSLIQKHCRDLATSAMFVTQPPTAELQFVGRTRSMCLNHRPEWRTFRFQSSDGEPVLAHFIIELKHNLDIERRSFAWLHDEETSSNCSAACMLGLDWDDFGMLEFNDVFMDTDRRVKYLRTSESGFLV
ncbi:hypothetical protein AC579_8557 [Pseudocercospora musae]|uniref:Uncharacterized protein n=1 Tax=Pseudocercospora musae TaxID=113226 RepID=A0A139I8L9_9PEZI|nr:hypothetical protein AC579_8557 [Pseudocercospora musae]